MKHDRLIYGIGLILFGVFIFYTTSTSWPFDPQGYCQSLISTGVTIIPCVDFIQYLYWLSYALIVFGVLLICYALFWNRTSSTVSTSVDRTKTKLEVNIYPNSKLRVLLINHREYALPKKIINIKIANEEFISYLTDENGVIVIENVSKNLKIIAKFEGDNLYLPSIFNYHGEVTRE